MELTRSLRWLTRKNGTHSFIARHLTARRLLNYLTVKAERRLRRSVVRGRPYNIIVDTCNVCNYRCPLCRTGAMLNPREKRMMSYEDFQRLVEPLARDALFVTLHNWGEPFLNKDIYKIIGYAGSLGLATRLSSNLYEMDEGDLEKVVDSGLNHLIVSIDGASEETYVKYRVGGKFARVFENLKTLLEIRERKRSWYPIVEWQFLVMRHNEHEMAQVRRLAEEVGVDLLTMGPIGFGETPYDGTENKEEWDEWLPRNNPAYRYPYGKPGPLTQSSCFFLWESITLNGDGGLAPCCVLDESSMDFGNALGQPVSEIWNNELYQSARREFNPRLRGKPGKETACSRCMIFDKG